jgi:hypothetical protein
MFVVMCITPATVATTKGGTAKATSSRAMKHAINHMHSQVGQDLDRFDVEAASFSFFTPFFITHQTKIAI